MSLISLKPPKGILSRDVEFYGEALLDLQQEGQQSNDDQISESKSKRLQVEQTLGS